MKKLIYIIAVLMTVQVFAQNQGEKINKALNALFMEDCDKCDFPESEKRARATSILNEYRTKAKWPYKEFKENDLGWLMANSQVVSGSQLQGAIYEFRSADEVKVTAPEHGAEYIAFKGLPYIKLEGTVMKKPKIVMKELEEPERLKEPVVSEIPEIPKVQAVDDVHADGSGSIVINNYITCTHDDKKSKVEDPSTYTSPMRVKYDGYDYEYRDGEWRSFGSGLLVGGGIALVLSNLFLTPASYNNNCGSYYNNRGNITYGSNRGWTRW